MKITLCGSIAFYEEMLKIKKELEEKGYEVKLPPIEVKDDKGNMISVKKYYELRKQEQKEDSWIWDRKEEAIKLHFNKVEWSDAILVTNFDKKGVKGYIGGNTLIEIGLAFHLNKKIYFLNEIPEIGYKEELLGMKPTVIKRDLSQISKAL